MRSYCARSASLSMAASAAAVAATSSAGVKATVRSSSVVSVALPKMARLSGASDSSSAALPATHMWIAYQALSVSATKSFSHRSWIVPLTYFTTSA